MIKVSSLPALILIDIQEGFDDPKWGVRNNPHAEENAGRLLDFWREYEMPVYHIQHLSVEPDSPLRPELPGSAIKAIVKPLPGEPVLTKNVNSGFIGTDLEKRLRAEKATDLVIVGLTTDHCVSTTTRMAANLGFNCFVIEDATATFNRRGHDGREWSAEDIHASALASLNHEFATVFSAAQAISTINEAVSACRLDSRKAYHR